MQESIYENSKEQHVDQHVIIYKKNTLDTHE